MLPNYISLADGFAKVFFCQALLWGLAESGKDCADGRVRRAMARARDAGLVQDSTLSWSSRPAARFWRMRAIIALQRPRPGGWGPRDRGVSRMGSGRDGSTPSPAGPQRPSERVKLTIEWTLWLYKGSSRFSTSRFVHGQ
jgi:hypothetical protein